MRRILLFVLLAFIGFTIRAQYRKMPLDTNHYWTEQWLSTITGHELQCNITLKVIKDSVLYGKTYQYVQNINPYCTPPSFSPWSGLIRQDTVRKLIIQYVSNNNEQILYNFNKNVGDTAMFGGTNVGTYTLQTKDSVLLNDTIYYRRYKFQGPPPMTGTVTVIEGIGSTYGLLSPWVGFEAGYTLECFGRTYPNQKSIYGLTGLGWNFGSSCPLLTGIPSNQNDKKSLNIYPNPGSDLIRINAGNVFIESIEIKNTLGQTVSCQSNINRESSEVNIADLAQGVYFLKINSGNQNLTGYFIKN